ncbi:cytochrome P450 CYP72A219-like [Lycium ferocissimum]|uniref:cytochrome P450 CYP72A219-like n=1 Tax=Lycium ferocissimum TaxID=112874 RepID=UPI0028164F90|nr:cytochrome P450 CYP72A219-like [Lycium ferocissimum]
MEIAYYLVSFLFAFTLVVIYAWRLLNWAWFRPKKLERCLRKKGLKGNSYKLISGDLKESSKSIEDAKSKPLNVSDDDISPRILPYIVETIKKHGKNCFMWVGPKPMILVKDPEVIKDVFIKHAPYHKPNSTPLTKLLVQGVATYEEDKWAKHRKILNPAFHMEKIKLATAGATVTNDELVVKILSGLGSDFREISAAIRARDSIISYDELYAKLIDYELFLKHEELKKETTAITAAMVTHNRSTNSNNRTARRPNNNSQWRSNSRTNAPAQGRYTNYFVRRRLCNKRRTSRKCRQWIAISRSF